MPTYNIDDSTARQLDEMAARRDVHPEALLVELILRATGRPGLSRRQSIPATVTKAQLDAIDEDVRQYWIERQKEDLRDEWALGDPA